MARKDALRIRINKTTGSAGLQTILSEPVELGWMWCVEHTAWEISKATSGGNTRCRLYIDGHGYKHNIAEQDAPAASTLYTWSKNEYLYPGERLALDIDQGQASTDVEICLTGYKEAIKDA
jgi:hypothetical protein